MIVVGVDLGGTSARAAIFDDGVERDTAEAAGSPMRVGHGAAIAHRLAELVRPLLLRSRSVRADVLVVGASGAGREAERHELERALDAQRLAWKVIVTTDAELARAAAFGGGPGVLLIAGTGSIAVARDGRGETRRVGGLGWRMGDQGSAYWIGARALEAVGAMHDGLGTVTRLTESLCTAAQVPGVAGLVRWSAVATPADVAALCPSVLAAADRNDPVAAAIRDAAVGQLVQLALAAGAGPLPVALAGGLLGAEGPLRGAVAAALTECKVIVQLRTIEPCRGAPEIARGQG